jgi:hypothetical protein
MAAGTQPASPGTQPFANLGDEIKYIVSGARQLNLDPAAVLSVAEHEGLGAGAGDNNTSFGPFQLHFGGRYPAQAPQNPTQAQEWANSPVGVSYALAGIAGVASRQTGDRAIDSIVRNFEQPASPDPEVAKAQATYGKWQSVVQTFVDDSGSIGSETSSAASAIGSAATHIPGVAQVSGAVSSVGGGISSVEDAIKFVFSYRFLEILGGGALVLVGVIGLMREVGLKAPSLPGAIPPELAEKAARAPRPAWPIDAGSDSDRRVARTTSYGKRQATGDDIPY